MDRVLGLLSKNSVQKVYVNTFSSLAEETLIIDDPELYK